METKTTIINSNLTIKMHQIMPVHKMKANLTKI